MLFLSDRVVGRILRVVRLSVLVGDGHLDVGRRLLQVADRVGGEEDLVDGLRFEYVVDVIHISLCIRQLFVIA